PEPAGLKSPHRAPPPPGRRGWVARRGVLGAPPRGVGGQDGFASAMGWRLVGDALDRAFRRTHGRAGDRLHLLARAFRVVDPLAVEAVGAGGDAGGFFE